MIIDKILSLSELQAVTSTASSTNYVDAIKAGDALSGAELYLFIRVGTAATAAGAATVTFSLETATDSAFTSPVTLWASSAIGKASLTANKVMFKVKVPVGLLQYTRVTYTVATGPLTAGTFDAFLLDDVDVLLGA